MHTFHPLLSFVTPVLGGVVLGALFGGGECFRRMVLQQRLAFGQACWLVPRIVGMLMGAFLVAGQSITDLALCAFGLAIALVEMWRIAGDAETERHLTRLAPATPPGGLRSAAAAYDGR